MMLSTRILINTVSYHRGGRCAILNLELKHENTTNNGKQQTTTNNHKWQTIMSWSSPIYIRWHELTSFGAQWLLLLGWQSWPALFWAPVPRPHIYKLWSNFGGKEKVWEMSPGHLVKSSLGDVVGQDPLIAFSKVCLCGLERKKISELLFVTHTQGMSESRWH